MVQEEICAILIIYVQVLKFVASRVMDVIYVLVIIKTVKIL